MALKLHSLSDSVRAVISAKIQEITCTAVSAVCSCVCPPGKTVSYSCSSLLSDSSASSSSASAISGIDEANATQLDFLSAALLLLQLMLMMRRMPFAMFPLYFLFSCSCCFHCCYCYWPKASCCWNFKANSFLSACFFHLPSLLGIFTLHSWEY